MRTVCISAAVLILLVTVTACGGGGTHSDPVVARVGNNVITRSTVSHWMSVLAGGDYFGSLGHKAPGGLASDPPNYPACVSAVVAIESTKPKSDGRPTGYASREGKCKRLYQALKAQAVSFLISVLWSVEEGAEMGFKVTNAEIMQRLRKIKAEQFPSAQVFATYLSNRRLALPDELYLLKRNLLVSKVLSKLQSAASRAGGSQAAFVAFAEQEVKRMTAKTSCDPGYIVQMCKQYKSSPSTSTPVPDILFEEMAGRA